MNSDKEKIAHLEEKVKGLEENVHYLKNLLTHIKSQFHDFKKGIDEELKRR